jgi:hypothetical protein
MRMIFAAAAALLALGGCQQAAENVAVQNDAVGTDNTEDAATNEDVAAGNFIDTVVNLPERQMWGVLNRAVMDAENKCDGVNKSEREPDSDGHPVYRAYCRDGTTHLVIFSADGTAKVLSPQAR